MCINVLDLETHFEFQTNQMWSIRKILLLLTVLKTQELLYCINLFKTFMANDKKQKNEL